MERGRFVPSTEIKSSNIRVNMNLPHYVNPEKIGFEEERIQRLLNLGGIRSVRVTTESGDRSQTTPSIAGYDSQGTATGGQSIIRREVSIYSAKLDPRQQDPIDYLYMNPLAKRWVDGSITINRDEIAQKISQKEKNRGVRATREW